MSLPSGRTLLPIAKAVLALLIVGGVVWFFARILQSDELVQADRSQGPLDILVTSVSAAHPPGLILAGVLYLAGLTFWALFWVLLLRWVREPLPLPVGLRACYLSHLGKYVPFGKGWALLLRVGLAVEAGIRPGTAAVTCAHETLTTMASGALLAVLLMSLTASAGLEPLALALGMLLLAGVPLLPGVFRFLVQRIGRRFGRPEESWPHLGIRVLLAGLALTAVGWALLGASLAATLTALEPGRADDLVGLWLRGTAFVCMAYVAGFVAATPGGLGVRELILQQFLAPELGARAVVVVIVLRLLWTVVELTVAGVVYWCPGRVRQA